MDHVFVYQEWDILKENMKEHEPKIERSMNTSSRTSFGFMIQESRIRKRLTTIDLANALNVSSRMISMYENGSEVPTGKIATELFSILEL